MEMHRMTDPAAKENDALESFYLCNDCTGGAVSVEMTIAVSINNTINNYTFTAELLETKGPISAYDEVCINCCYSPRDEGEDDDDAA